VFLNSFILEKTGGEFYITKTMLDCLVQCYASLIYIF